MEASKIRGLAGQHSAPPDVARNVRILLVDHDTESLMYLASYFGQESNIIVTATESANAALAMLKEKKFDCDAVIADRHMPDMNIYDFVHEVHDQHMNISVMLIDDENTVDSVQEATLQHKVCCVFSKPLTRLDLESFWQHIPRVTPTNTIQSNSEKTRLFWSPSLHQQFLNAVQKLGKDATPNRILSIMGVRCLTYRQVASHLQTHRSKTRHSAYLPRSASPSAASTSGVVIPSGHLSSSLQAPNQDAGTGMYREGSGNRFV